MLWRTQPCPIGVIYSESINANNAIWQTTIGPRDMELWLKQACKRTGTRPIRQTQAAAMAGQTPNGGIYLQQLDHQLDFLWLLKWLSSVPSFRVRQVHGNPLLNISWRVSIPSPHINEWNGTERTTLIKCFLLQPQASWHRMIKCLMRTAAVMHNTCKSEMRSHGKVYSWSILVHPPRNLRDNAVRNMFPVSD